MSEVFEALRSAPSVDMVKALNEQAEKAKTEPKSALIDPINVMMYGGTRGKPTSIPYGVLRRMAQVPAIAAVINTRLNQVARFAKRPRYKGDIGFQVTLKDPDKAKDMTDAQRKRAREIEDFFLKTGWERNRVRKDNFDTFLRKVVRDSLEIDVMTFEKVPDMKGEVAEVWAMDGSTIELVVNNSIGEGAEYDVPVYRPVTRSGIQHIGEIAYVQKINGVVVAEFTEDELAFAIRNPRTDIMYTDFGMSELETLMEIVTGIVNGVRYNTSYFSHSHLPQGVLEVVGKYQDKHLEGFKRHWKNLTQGAPGKWSVPVMGLEEGQGFKFTPFKNSNRDMEFNQFLEFLFNIACAVYQIDPNEVGFKSWTSNTSTMGQSDNTQVKMDESKDKGFVPLMTFLQNTFNSEIIELMDDEFVFEWVGIDDEDEDRKMEQRKARLESGLSTVAMEREADGEEPILGPDGKPAAWTLAPANPQLIQVFMAEMQGGQEGEEGAEEGAEGEEQEDLSPEQEREHAVEDGETEHQRKLEIMEKEHEQTLEQKEHEHKLGMEAQKQIAKQEAAAPKAEGKKSDDKKDDKPKQEKKDLKKSIEDEFAAFGIEVDWTDY